MAKALAQKTISLKSGPKELHDYLQQYQARYYNDSSTEKGHVYWTPASGGMWMLVMKKGDSARITFHGPDDCPCSKL